MRFEFLYKFFIFLFIVFGLSACAQVKPYERGRLAKPEMAWQVDKLSASLDKHIYFSKEGSSGGGSAVGGGCGCN